MSNTEPVGYLGYADPEEFTQAFNKRRVEVLAEHGPPVPTVSRGQVLGLGRVDTFDRFVLDLLDRGLFTVNTALDLFEIGRDMGAGTDRAGTASIIAMCFWVSDEPLLAVGFGLMAAGDGGGAGEVGAAIAAAVNEGLPFTVISDGYASEREQIAAVAESTFVTTGY